MIKLALTCGDINGIGPEIILKSIPYFLSKKDIHFTVIIPKNVVDFQKRILSPVIFAQIEKSEQVEFNFIDDTKIEIGKPTSESGNTSYNAILIAHKMAISKKVDGIVTSPISKEAFHLANINYKGHTDLLVELTSAKNHMMVFLSDNLKTGLATIHVPIKEVSSSIDFDLIKNKLLLAKQFLNHNLALENGKIAVLGLNPHSGENGILGNEEIDKIIPAIKSFGKNSNIFGPFVPDAFFGTKNYQNYDFILGMYHDQVLIPFKLLNFNNGVNFTAGLPYIRTSPDHGTAFDIAGKNISDESSLVESIKWAIKLIEKRNGK